MSGLLRAGLHEAGRLARSLVLTAGLMAIGSLAQVTAQPWRAFATSERSSTVHRVAVFGVDERVKLPDQFKQLRDSIGIIYNEQSRTVCSAFCVADSIVATASHCMYRTKGEKPPPPERFVFSRPGTQHQPARIAGAGVRAAAQHILAGASGISTKPPIEAGQDWALVRLDRDACSGHQLPLMPLTEPLLEAEAAAGRLFQVAFHRDFNNWILAYSKACQTGRQIEEAGDHDARIDFRDPRFVVLHTCDTGNASSGSPLLVLGSSGPQVAAINVGTFVRSRVWTEDGVVVGRLPVLPVANTAVSVAAFADKLAAFRSAEILKRVSEVRALQSTLLALRLYEGPLDGVYGAKLRGAIHDFENLQGTTPTGLPTSALLRRLNHDALSSPVHR